MPEDWPPDGYSDPIEYSPNQLVVVIIGLAVATFAGIYALPIIERGGVDLVTAWGSIANGLGLAQYPILLVISYVIVLLLWMLVLAVISFPLHELIHYSLGQYFGLNPAFRWDDSFPVKNPSVVALSTRITVREDLWMLISPFISIGVITLVVSYFFNGVLAASAAFILLTNSAGSSLDLYHAGRLLQMPDGTEFANFVDDEEKIRTEYVVPEEKIQWSGDEPDWAKVVQTLYHSKTPRFSRSVNAPGSIPVDSPMIEKTELTHQELRSAVDYLIDAGLLEIRGGDVFVLTEEGFNIAHERDLALRRNKLSRSLVVFTSITVLVNTVGLFETDEIRIAGGFLLLLLVVYLTIWGELW